jgi:hypothetical protein
MLKITLYDKKFPPMALPNAVSSAKETVVDLSERLTVSERRSLDNENFFLPV